MSANPTQAGAVEALYALGHWLLGQGRPEDGKHVFRTMLRSAPADERGWLALGACHEATQEHAKAEQLYRLAPKACAYAVRSHVALGRLLHQLGRDDEAEAVFETATELAAESDDDGLVELVRREAVAA